MVNYATRQKLDATAAPNQNGSRKDHDMADKSLPCPDVLRQLLRYEPETGKLFWLRRDVCFFGNSLSPDGYCKSWNSKYADKEALTSTNVHGYKAGRILNKTLLAHRAIWAIMMDKFPDDQVDHINGIRTDNRFSNLRSVSQSENAKNTKMPASNTSGNTGVRFDKIRKKWSAQIVLDRKMIWLGYHPDKASAISERRKAELDYGFHTNHGKPQELRAALGTAMVWAE